MKALFYDTETTGLPEWKKPSEDPSQPRVIQLAAELVLIDGQQEGSIASMDVIIRPDGWTIPPDIAEMTGITQEMAMDVGTPMDDALSMFMALWGRSELLVAHNASFDQRMIRIELMRTKADAISTPEVAEKWKAAPAYCTMRKAQTAMGGKKFPKLSEAFSHFTGANMANAHNAVADVAACKAVYMALKRRESPQDASAGGARPVTLFGGSPAETKVEASNLWPGA